MADKPLSVYERGLVKLSLQTQRAVILRKRSGELPASEIYDLRSKEIAILDQLIVRYS